MKRFQKVNHEKNEKGEKNFKGFFFAIFRQTECFYYFLLKWLFAQNYLLKQDTV